MSDSEAVREFEFRRRAPATYPIDISYQEARDIKLATEQVERARSLISPSNHNNITRADNQNHHKPELLANSSSMSQHKLGYETNTVEATNLVSRQKRHHESEELDAKGPHSSPLSGTNKRSFRLDDAQYEQIQRQMLQSAIDSKHLVKSISDLPTFVTIEGFRIASYSLGGEPYLCLAQLLRYLKQEFPIERVVNQFEESMTNFTDATPKQIDGFIKASVLPAGATNCALIKRSDADRICLSLFDRFSKTKWSDIVDLCSKPGSSSACTKIKSNGGSASAIDNPIALHASEASLQLKQDDNDQDLNINVKHDKIKDQNDKNEEVSRTEVETNKPREANGYEANHCDDKNPSRKLVINAKTGKDKVQNTESRKIAGSLSDNQDDSEVDVVKLEAKQHQSIKAHDATNTGTRQAIATNQAHSSRDTSYKINISDIVGMSNELNPHTPSSSSFETPLPSQKELDTTKTSSGIKSATSEALDTENSPASSTYQCESTMMKKSVKVTNDQTNQELNGSPREAHLFEAEAQGIILDLAKAVTSTLMIHVYHRCSGKNTGLFYPSLARQSDSECIECTVCHIMLAPRRFVGHTHGNKENHVLHWGFNSYNWRHYIRLSKKQPMNNLDDDELLVQFKLLLSVEDTSDSKGAATDDIIEKANCGLDVDNYINDQQYRHSNALRTNTCQDYNSAINATAASRPYAEAHHHQLMVTATDQKQSHFISHMFDPPEKTSSASTSTSTTLALTPSLASYGLCHHHNQQQIGRLHSIVDGGYSSLYTAANSLPHSPTLHHPRSIKAIAPSSLHNNLNKLHQDQNTYASFRLPRTTEISIPSRWSLDYTRSYGDHLDSLEAQNMTPLELLSSLSERQFRTGGAGSHYHHLGSSATPFRSPGLSTTRPFTKNEGPTVNGLGILPPDDLLSPSHHYLNLKSNKTSNVSSNFKNYQHPNHLNQMLQQQQNQSRLARNRELHLSNNLSRFLMGKGLNSSFVQEIVDNTLCIVRESNSLFQPTDD